VTIVTLIVSVIFFICQLLFFTDEIQSSVSKCLKVVLSVHVPCIAAMWLCVTDVPRSRLVKYPLLLKSIQKHVSMSCPQVFIIAALCRCSLLSFAVKPVLCKKLLGQKVY